MDEARKLEIAAAAVDLRNTRHPCLAEQKADVLECADAGVLGSSTMVVAHSLAVYLMLHTLLESGIMPARLILVSGAFTRPDHLGSVLGNIDPRYWPHDPKMQLRELARRLRGRIFMVHGVDDDVVPPELALYLARILEIEIAWLPEGSGHINAHTQEHNPQAMDRFAEYIRSHCRDLLAW
jgi:predicted alpha/beta hydrolase family esterase